MKSIQFLTLIILSLIACTPDGILFNKVHYKDISVKINGKDIEGEGFAETSGPKQNNLYLILRYFELRPNEIVEVRIGLNLNEADQVYDDFQSHTFLSEENLLIQPFSFSSIIHGEDLGIGSYDVDTTFSNRITLDHVRWGQVKGHGQLRYVKEHGSTEDTLTLTDIKFKVKKYLN